MKRHLVFVALFYSLLYQSTPAAAQNMQYVSNSLIRVATTTIEAGTKDSPVLRLAITVSGANNSPLVLNEVRCAIPANSQGVRSVHLRYSGNSDQFSPNLNGLGSYFTDPNTNEWVFQPDFPLFPFTTQYFWVTYDVSLCTPSGTVLGGALNSFILGGVSRTPANPNPAGQATVTVDPFLKFTSKSNGDWHNDFIWEGEESPCDNSPISVVINSNVDVAFPAQVLNRITVNNGKTLKVKGAGNLVLGNGNTDTRLFLEGKLRVENGLFHLRGNISSTVGSELEIAGGVFRCGDAGGDNKDCDLNGDVTLTNGLLEANGSLLFPTVSNLTMSGGQIVVDPNGGSLAKSANSGLSIYNNPVLSGGTITIVDPVFSGTGKAFEYGGLNGPALNGTLVIGGTSGTHPSTAATGFKIYGGDLTIANLVINGGRKSNFRQASLDGDLYAAQVTINSGSELEMLNFASLLTGTSLANNGICSACALSFSDVNIKSAVPSAATSAQSLTGTGFFKKSATDPDPLNQADNKILRLFVHHSQASPGLSVHMPLTVTDEFWPEGGKMALTNNYVLTIGESASNPGTVNDATRATGHFPTGWITTPLRRWTKAIGQATGYNETALFPVGDATRRRQFYLAHPSGVATAGTLTVQFVNEDPGTSGFPLTWGSKLMVSSSPTGYWNVTNNGVSGAYNVMADGNGFQNRTGDLIGFTEEMSVMRRSNGVWAANEGAPQTPSGLNRLRSEGFSTYGDFGITGTAILFGTPKTFSTVSTAQPQTSAVDAGSSFISVVRVDVEVFGTQNNLPVTELVFHTNGTTNTFDLRNAQVYYTGTSATFTNTTPFGSVVANPDGTLTFSGNQELIGSTGLTTNYFWLSYDIRYCAPTGNLVDGELVSLTVGGTNYQPANGNPGTGRSVNAFGMFNYRTIADGNWGNFDIWDDGCIPRNVTNTVTIGHNVTVSGNANTDGNVTLQAGKTLTIAPGGTLNVGLPPGDNNIFTTQTGATLAITGGTFNLFGSVSFTGATFSMNAGQFNIDPNSGTAGVSGTTVLNFPSNATCNVTGGNITLVDPPFGSGSYSLAFLSGTNLFNLNATLTLGGSTGVNSSANADGFRINTGATTRGLVFAHVVVNGGRKSDNRQVWVDGGYLYCGNLSVNAGCELEMRDGGSASELAVSGNLLNNGVISIPSNRRLVFHGGFTVGPLSYQQATSAQALSGTGVFKLLSTDPDPAQQTEQQLGQLAVYHSAASPGLNCQMPLIVSNVLRLSAGRINLSAPNRLQLGTAAGAGTLADLTASGWINGAFHRWTKAAGAAYTVADNFSYFPVGDASTRRLIRVAFPSGGPVASGLLSAQFIGAAPGSAGLPVSWGGMTVKSASGTGYWQLGTTGAGGTYTARVDATGFVDCSGGPLQAANSIRLLKRPGSGSWTAAEGSASVPAAFDAVEGSGFSTFSEFGIGLNQGLTASCKNLSVALNGSAVTVAAADLSDNSTGCGSLSYSVAGQSSVQFTCSQLGTPQQLTLSVTDGQNNTATCQATVTVSDNTPPALNCPANQNLNTAAGQCTQTYVLADPVSDNCSGATWSATFSGNPGGNPAPTGNLSDGSNSSPVIFQRGTTTVTLQATDNAANLAAACTFSVTVTDAEKPLITCPANSTIAAGANCSAVIGAFALATKSDNCTAPGSITESQNPAASTLLSGHNSSQTVTLTANDGHGNSESCSFTVTLLDATPPAVSCPANQALSPTETAPCSALAAGIQASPNDNCGIAGLSYTLSGATSGSGSGQAEGIWFAAGLTTVTYTATDGAGLTTACVFTVTVGACSNNTVFSGTIRWEQDGTSGVQNAAVGLSGATTGTDMSDTDGGYLIAIPYLSGNFSLKPIKNTNKLNGVSSADAQAIQQHLANSNLLPAPFKRIAADVNKSNSISTLDVTLINQALLGNPAALNQITSWRFVPAAYVFPNPNIPWGFPENISLTGVSGSVTGQDFKGIKLGDVVSTWANPANFGGSGASGLVFGVQDQVLEAGSELVAEFQAGPLEDLNSFQFALDFDAEQLQLLNIETLGGLPLSMENFGTYQVEHGEIRVVWAQAKPLHLHEAAPAFRLHFQALASGARLSEVLQLNEDAIPARVYNSAFAESGVALHFTSLTNTQQDVSEAIVQLDNRPNPFTGVTTLQFLLPQAGEAELRVHDAAGRLVFSHKKYYAAGQHQETLRLDAASGMLMAELRTPFGAVRRKMIAVQN
ncbi:MAG: HYR domain-containing protein [Saprospiraceae bacterium]|nr:HYR domain-containing protein [Saprospiraceae bacterium]